MAIVKIKLAVCDTAITNSEPNAASFNPRENKMYKSTRLIGPPPIPKKAEKSPNKIPDNKTTGIFFTCKPFILFLKILYNNAPARRTSKTHACTRTTNLSFPTAFFTRPNKRFPDTPPAAAPNASGVTNFIGGFEALRLRIMDTIDMESTIQPQRKFAVALGSSSAASTTGFTMTPPPIPVNAPNTEAEIAIIKSMNACKFTPSLRQM